MDTTKHLNIDKLPQKVGARAYLINVGGGYISSSDDEDQHLDNESFFSQSMRSVARPRARIQSHQNQSNYQNRYNLRKNHSEAASVGTHSLLDELIGNYNHDREFSRKLDSEFDRIKRQDERQCVE